MQQIRCALLTFVIGLLLVSASCGDEGAVPTSGAAGKVIEVEGTGTVTAIQKGAEDRVLSLGDTVFVKDTIKTSAGASVSIEFAHNRAVWNLDENQETAIEESIAWRLAKQEASAFAKQAIIGNSAAAANHGQTAADTSDTLLAASADESIETENETPTATTTTTTNLPDLNLVEQDPADKNIEGKPRTPKTKPRPETQGPPPPPIVDGVTGGPRTFTRPPEPTPGGGKLNEGGGGEGGGGGSDKDARDSDKDARDSANPNKNTRGLSGMASAERAKSVNQAATRKLIEVFARGCQGDPKRTGDLNYTFVVKAGKFVSFTSLPGDTLAAISKCVRGKLKSTKLEGSGEVKGKIRL